MKDLIDATKRLIEASNHFAAHYLGGDCAEHGSGLCGCNDGDVLVGLIDAASMASEIADRAEHKTWNETADEYNAFIRYEARRLLMDYLAKDDGCQAA